MTEVGKETENEELFPEAVFGEKDYLSEVFGLEQHDIRMYSPLTLAYIGDAAYEIVIRTILVRKANMQVNKLHRHAAGLVKAEKQSAMIEILEPLFTKEDDTLAAYIKETLFPMEDALDFSLIDDYLALDPYFCPVPEEGSFDAFFLYTAISILENAFDEFALGDELAIIDDLILTKYPVLGSVALDDADIRLDALIGSGAEFYAVLYLALTRYPSALGSLLPQFGAAYHDSYQFTGDDTALYDFMDEYFETKNCMLQPFFVELSNTLVDATLGYYKTDLETLLAAEVPGLLSGTASRFAVQKRFGALGLTRLPDHDTCLALLSESFRYAALYELRSNLFDYHLEEDRLVTADNWKDTIRFHFVQYQHIYEQALDGFYAAVLSRKLLLAEFSEELKKLGF